ncbi:hypothetical protein NW837_11325 [Synechococcus sp. R6-10]|nr:hypothetical protein [Cyanobacteriota bacterium PSP.bin.10]
MSRNIPWATLPFPLGSPAIGSLGGADPSALRSLQLFNQVT